MRNPSGPSEIPTAKLRSTGKVIRDGNTEFVVMELFEDDGPARCAACRRPFDYCECHVTRGNMGRHSHKRNP